MTEFKPNEAMFQNYIQKKLSPKDTEQLELWLADHPEVMQELEMDLMLSQADFDPSTQNKTTKKPSFSLWDFFASKKLVPINVLAYGLALLFVFNSLINNGTNENFSPATFIELEQTRGVDDSIIEVNTYENKSLVLRFFPDSMSQKYSVVMNSISKNKTIEFNNLLADDFGSITLSLIKSKNLVGKWEITVINDTKNIEQSYYISIGEK